MAQIHAPIRRAVEAAGGMGDYLAATAADEIWAQPKSNFGVAGAGVGAPLKRRVERPQAGHCRSAVVRIRSPPHIPFCSMHDQ